MQYSFILQLFCSITIVLYFCKMKKKKQLKEVFQKWGGIYSPKARTNEINNPKPKTDEKKRPKF